jgi:integrase/recombinase XerD
VAWGQRLGVSDLTSERVEQFFAMRRKRGQTLYVSPLALRPLWAHLLAVGAVPTPETAEPTPLEALLSRYRRYLIEERGLGERTCPRYIYVAKKFLLNLSSDGELDLASVRAEAATEFVTLECATRSVGWAKAVAVGLRSFLRFLHLEGLIEYPPAQVIPTPASWRAASLPEVLTPIELSALLASCDRRSAAGQRDYAVLLLLARLGLRAGEVARLELAAIDWRGGELSIRGKGPRVDVLPLPLDVGRALASYVRTGRPRRGRGALFRCIGAPYGPLSPTTVTGIVYRACDRTGLPRVGAHRIRHTAATQMLRSGASLPEVAHALRHTNTATTAVYAKVDRLALAALARPWPGGAS